MIMNDERFVKTKKIEEYGVHRLVKISPAPQGYTGYLQEK
jgi:hypothetical protein